MPTVNVNQFAQVPVQGDLDLGIMQTGTLSGKIGGSDSLKAGTPVKLDATATGHFPVFIAAAVGDVCLGFLKRTLKQSLFAPGDVAEATVSPSPVMFLTAKNTVAMGATVESGSDPLTVQTLAGQKPRGTALDSGTDGQLIRVLLANAASATLA